MPVASHFGAACPRQLMLQSAVLAAYALSSARAAACFSAPGNSFSMQDWNCQELTPMMALYYKVQEEETTLRLGIHAQDHNGWVGIGINGNGGMKGGSFIIVRMVEGIWVAEDRHAHDYSMPTLDEQQDVTLIDVQKSNSDITWIVSLPLSSCDKRDYQIKDIDQRVLWAKGSSHMFTPHGSQAGVDRGSTEINFYRQLVQVIDPADAFTIDFRLPDVNVKATEDESKLMSAVCAAFELAKLGVPEGKLHMTKYSPILTPASSKYVHQVLFSPCLGEQVPHFVENAGSSNSSTWVQTDCADSMLACTSRLRPIFAWSVGAGDVVFPEEAGYEIDTSDVRYLTMKVLYYSPTTDIDIVDSSGIQLTVTPTLRPQTIGFMTLYAGPLRPLTPGLQRATRSLQVPSMCIDKALPEELEELTLVKVYQHQHLRGVEMQIRVISSDWQDQGLLHTEKRADFDHQHLAPPEITRLHRTDQILMTCEFDMSNETEPIRHGNSFIENEMCLGQLYYYPAQPRYRFFAFGTANQSRTFCGRVGIVHSEPFQFTLQEEDCGDSSASNSTITLPMQTTTTSSTSPDAASSANRIPSLALQMPAPLALICCLLLSLL